MLRGKQKHPPPPLTILMFCFKLKTQKAVFLVLMNIDNLLFETAICYQSFLSSF